MKMGPISALLELEVKVIKHKTISVLKGVPTAIEDRKVATSNLFLTNTIEEGYLKKNPSSRVPEWTRP